MIMRAVQICCLERQLISTPATRTSHPETNYFDTFLNYLFSSFGLVYAYSSFGTADRDIYDCMNSFGAELRQFEEI